MPTPIKKPQQSGKSTKYSNTWKGLYRGKWYEIEKVEEPKDGSANLYKLKGVPNLVKIEDLDPTGVAASREEIVMDKEKIRSVLAKRCEGRDMRDIESVATDIFYSGEPAAVLASSNLLDKLFSRLDEKKVEADKQQQSAANSNETCPLCRRKTVAVKLAGDRPAKWCSSHFVVFPVKEVK